MSSSDSWNPLMSGDHVAFVGVGRRWILRYRSALRACREPVGFGQRQPVQSIAALLNTEQLGEREKFQHDVIRVANFAAVAFARDDIAEQEHQEVTVLLAF